PPAGRPRLPGRAASHRAPCGPAVARVSHRQTGARLQVCRAQLGDPRLPHTAGDSRAVPARRIRGRPNYGLLDPVLTPNPARPATSLPCRATRRVHPWPAARRRPPGRRCTPERPGHRVTPPAASVLVAVHNGAPWVGDAVASVLARSEEHTSE